MAEDAGYAFPLHGIDGPTWEGMTLRDYFAAKALQGMASRDSYDPGQATPAMRAELAYIEADAMIRARAIISA